MSPIKRRILAMSPMQRRILAAACGSMFFSAVYLSGAALVPGPMSLLVLTVGLIAPPLVGTLWVLIVTKMQTDDDLMVSGEAYRRAIVRLAEREPIGGRR